MPSFTQRTSNLQQVGAVLEIILMPSIHFLQKMNLNPSEAKAVKLLAMVDTGATGTVISKGISALLGINPIGQH
jgi:predicted aspartyl protease